MSTHPLCKDMKHKIAMFCWDCLPHPPTRPPTTRGASKAIRRERTVVRQVYYYKHKSTRGEWFERQPTHCVKVWNTRLSPSPTHSPTHNSGKQGYSARENSGVTSVLLLQGGSWSGKAAKYIVSSSTLFFPLFIMISGKKGKLRDFMGMFLIQAHTLRSTMWLLGKA